MSEPVANAGVGLTEPRIPCPMCGELIIAGARKCRGCRQWLGQPPHERSRLSRSLTLIVAAVVAVAAVLLSTRKSPVGEAPPLTPIATGSAVAESDLPAGPTASESPELALSAAQPIDRRAAAGGAWKRRRLHLEVHPLDLVFGNHGHTLLVSGDDATLREYDFASGKMLHMTSLPAQGDSIRVLADRWVAILRRREAARIPVVDTTAWDRDPLLLWSGLGPADIIMLPDGHTVVTASSVGARLSWYELDSGHRLGDIHLPHAPRALYLLRTDNGPQVGSLGTLLRAGRPAGAWMDLFDPSEDPFGATRRSVSMGRDPRRGAVSRDGRSVLLVDQVSNSATLLSVGAGSKKRSATVGQGPVRAFLLTEDRFGVTLDQKSRTATVLAMPDMKRLSTLMLDGSPTGGAASSDGGTLVVALGGGAWPPMGSGAVVIAGDPPKVVASVRTDRGANRVAIDAHGTRAAIANYFARTITLISH